MFYRVFSSTLDFKKQWYALNTNVCGIIPKKFYNNEVFNLFKDEVFSRPIGELRNQNGEPISAKLFNAGRNTYHSGNVYVGTAFALIAGNLRRKNPNDSEFLKSKEFSSIIDIINNVDLAIDPPNITQSSPENSSSTSVSSESISHASGRSFTVIDEDIEDDQSFFRRRKIAPKCSSPLFTSSPNNSSRSSDSFNDTASTSNSASFEEIENRNYSKTYKRRKIRNKSSTMIAEIMDLCRNNNEELSNVIARCCLMERGNIPTESKEMIQDVFRKVEEELGLEKTFEELIPIELWKKKVKQMTVPDWQLLLLKLEVPISDDGWQKILNRTHLGKSGKSSSTSLLLTKNSIKALKCSVFNKVEGLFDIESIKDEAIPGYRVALEAVVCWQARELRLFGLAQNHIQMNLKLDGRPFGGRSQVLVGIIPMQTMSWSNHSCKSFFPLAIANCKEKRESLTRLILKLNKEKDDVKRNGITIDGQLYSVSFKVTLDLKALYLLLVKDDDPKFQLGGKGYNVEFCFFCQALRNCCCDLGPHSVCLEHFSTTKANIGSFKGIRDDLHFLLEEELTSINLCALHCELRNTEQLLGSLGLKAYEIGTLKECNKVLSEYGPESTGDRITVKLKEGQQTAVNKQNIKVVSFSGNTERSILENIEEIVRESIPHKALKDRYLKPVVAKNTLLNKVSFCSQQIRYYKEMISKGTFTRDHGKHQEEIPLPGTELHSKILDNLKIWQDKLKELNEKLSDAKVLFCVGDVSKKNRGKTGKKLLSGLDALADYTAEITYEFFLKVFIGWRDIALVMRGSVFGKDDQHLIDVYDLQCKEWGFLLREMFGVLLGTGDYGHMTIEHTSMLLREFGSLRQYSNQSIEAAHSMHRQLYSKATSHDRHGYTSSIRQMLVQFYSEKMLFQRLCFRKALECNNNGKPFQFTGCGWSVSFGKTIKWSDADLEWISKMDSLLTDIFGDDYLEYECDKVTKVVQISPESSPEFVYNHKEWEDNISTATKSTEKPSTFDPTSSTRAPTPPPTQDLHGQHNRPTDTATKSTEKPSTCTFDATSSTRAPTPPPTQDLHGQHNRPTDFPSPQPSAVNSSVPSTSAAKPNFVYPDLKMCTQSNLTRRQLSNIQLPPVVMLSQLDLDVIQNPLRFSNPLLIGVRPTEFIVKKCLEMLMQNPSTVGAVVDSDDDDIGIEINGLGVFNRHAIRIWDSATVASKISHDVKKEVRWLNDSKGILKKKQCDAIEMVLFNSKPHDQVLAIGDIIVDVHDLSTLVDERHLTGFLIDIASLKYKEESKNEMQTLYLPSFLQEWASAGSMKYLTSKILQYVQADTIVQIHWVLTPIHVAGAHWGLLCINVRSNQVYYDDGLHWDPPRDILAIVRGLLQSLHQIAGHKGKFNDKVWNLSLPMKRFGMPTQPPGSGSCGMGVIMSVNSIITGPLMTIPVFDWKFEDMHKHRRILMNKFIEWKNI